jgi:ubiquinone/menaquinone biosynthesis C-methylase UbiE
MDVTFKGISRLVAFIDKIEKDTYPEQVAPGHSHITASVLEALLPKYQIDKGSRILDIGCGQGPALDLLRDKGYLSCVGITLNDEDVRICREKGHDVRKMDQSFLDFQDESYDFVWARHVIEHSIFPYFTLAEFARVLRKGGLLYLEVPAPETSCHHERNPNHYSVLNSSAWTSLLERSGFSILENAHFSFTTGMGPDEYWGFICTKKRERA